MTCAVMLSSMAVFMAFVLSQSVLAVLFYNIVSFDPLGSLGNFVSGLNNKGEATGSVAFPPSVREGAVIYRNGIIQFIGSEH